MKIVYARVSTDEQNLALRRLPPVNAFVKTRGASHVSLDRPALNTALRTANGRLIFGIFAELAEFERELISERTKAGRYTTPGWNRYCAARIAMLFIAVFAIAAPAHQRAG